MRGSKKHNVKNVTIDKGKTRIKVGQSAKASINQGGNAFSINAVDIGVVRVRSGQQ